MAWTRAEIHYATGFDNGDLFRSAEEVRRYFTVTNITEMFGSCPYTQDELNAMADEVIAHRWHMVLPVEEYRTVYTDGFGAQLEAIQLPWSVVRSILGREYRGTAEDDAVLIERLLESGAPEWVRTADGWVDEHGWGLIGPEGTGFQSEMDESAFAEALGFDTFADLMAASESVVREGDIDWFITALPDGRWAAWDDAELSLDRVAYFDTREEAEAFHRDAYAEKYGEE